MGDEVNLCTDALNVPQVTIQMRCSICHISLSLVVHFPVLSQERSVALLKLGRCVVLIPLM